MTPKADQLLPLELTPSAHLSQCQLHQLDPGLHSPDGLLAAQVEQH
jgi:hypothetical protein